MHLSAFSSFDPLNESIFINVGALIKQNTLYQITSRSSSSDIAFKVKIKFILFDLEYDLENSIFHVASISKYLLRIH